MMCQRIGLPPISTIGFGRIWDSSLILVPRPPASMTTFITLPQTREPARQTRASRAARELQTGLLAYLSRPFIDPSKARTPERVRPLVITIALHSRECSATPLAQCLQN